VNHSKISVLVIAGIGAIAAAASLALPQQATDSARATASQSEPKPAANTAAASDTEATEAAAAIAKANAAAAAAGGKSSASKPSDEAVFAKKAKDSGWHREVRQGVTVYCREEPVIGSRFSEKKCATESRLALLLEQQEFDRDQLKQRGCGGNCGAK
jgi:hypothetical protein